MDKFCFGVIIKVRNLDVCRAFYKNILELGNPVIDSSFMCEFHTESGCSLILERAEWDDLPPEAHGRTSWILRINDYAGMTAKLKQYGYLPEDMDTEKYGLKLIRFKDPEGNPFYLTPGLESLDMETASEINKTRKLFI